MPRTSVLVTDGEERAALAIVRSLGQAGYRVLVCCTRKRSLAGASRYASGEALVPSPLLQPMRFSDAVQRLVRACNVDMLIPVSEASLLALLPVREQMDGVTIPFPPAATFQAVCDKAGLLGMAREVGIAVPHQHVVSDRSEADELNLESFRYPLVLKPSRSVIEIGEERGKVGVCYAECPDSLRSHLGRYPPSSYPILLQQRVRGEGVGIFVLRWNGLLIASFAHRRIREKPPSGGVSVYRESFAADPDLVARSCALLERFGWEGVAMIEYKIDAATGEPYLMEINGRFWGSLQLAVDSGVDFPRLLVECGLGRSVPRVTQYEHGIRSRWWWGDVDQLLARLRKSPADLALPAEAGGRLRALGEFLILWRPGDKNEIFRWRDPMPLLRETVDWFGSALGAGVAKSSLSRPIRLGSEAEHRQVLSAPAGSRGARHHAAPLPHLGSNVTNDIG